jgi:thioredoxin 1
LPHYQKKVQLHCLFKKLKTKKEEIMRIKMLTATAIFALFATLTAFAAGNPKTTETTNDALIHISSDAEFESTILKSEKPALVDFYADWCGPCRMLTPTIEKLAKDYTGKANIAKVNVDKFGELSGEYKVSGIPCVILFKDGKEVDRIVGKRSEKDYTDALDKIIK